MYEHCGVLKTSGLLSIHPQYKCLVIPFYSNSYQRKRLVGLVRAIIYIISAAEPPSRVPYIYACNTQVMSILLCMVLNKYQVFAFKTYDGRSGAVLDRRRQAYNQGIPVRKPNPCKTIPARGGINFNWRSQRRHRSRRRTQPPPPNNTKYYDAERHFHLDISFTVTHTYLYKLNVYL